MTTTITEVTYSKKAAKKNERYFSYNTSFGYNEVLATVQDWMTPEIILTRLSCHVPYFPNRCNLLLLWSMDNNHHRPCNAHYATEHPKSMQPLVQDEMGKHCTEGRRNHP
jgi:hypothetical protein